MQMNLSLAGRLREVLLDGHWIANTNFKAQISSVNWEQATQKVGNLNTIAALTCHINYYLQGLSVVLEGGALEIRDQYSFNTPDIPSEGHWRTLVQIFIQNSEIFADLVEELPEDLLDQPFVDPKYGNYLRNIEGVIEHCYYHLGQISLIKKLIIK
jgi:hypothetical protein